MSKEVYKELLGVMQKRGGAYCGMDIPEFFAMVEELFSPEEAAVNNAMPRGPFQASDLAKQMGRGESELVSILEGMADKGLCVAMKMEETQFYMAARFMPGILEFQFMPGKITDRAKRIAQVIYEYERAFDANSDPRASTFPTSRVITVDRVIEAGNQIHTYDQVRSVIEKHENIAVSACYCRHAALLRGEDIHDMPTDVCMQFGVNAQFAAQRLGAKMVTKDEALEVLARAEEAGLIHMTQNTTDDIDFLCNCDRWHCVAMKAIMAKPKPGVFFNSGYDPYFDPDLCVACGTCIDRCPPEALSMGDDEAPVVDFDKCFGCAVCATGCPSEAITMHSKPEFPAPPKDRKELKEAVKASRSFS
ncbi:MAG: 4Fe-4S binding protein [Desulfatibacillum sp.]|nr:4Fe-4S binding protein [Desulfatibacillum sp.]